MQQVVDSFCCWHLFIWFGWISWVCVCPINIYYDDANGWYLFTKLLPSSYISTFCVVIVYANMPKARDISSLLQLISTCEIDTQKYVCVSSIYYHWYICMLSTILLWLDIQSKINISLISTLPQTIMQRFQSLYFKLTPHQLWVNSQGSFEPPNFLFINWGRSLFLK